MSIGNVAVGGAGKTPAAIAVAARLTARGRRVAVLSRGYGASRADARIVSDGVRVLLGGDEAGDEPALLARRLPGVAVLCGPRRAALATMAVATLGADALVLDDGFQHRALARDLDVVVLDAANPFGNGHLLPRGPNREPRAALSRAGLVWLSRVDQADASALEALRSLAREATGRAPVESRHAPVDVVDGTLARSLGRGALRGAPGARRLRPRPPGRVPADARRPRRRSGRRARLPGPPSLHGARARRRAARGGRRSRARW